MDKLESKLYTEEIQVQDEDSFEDESINWRSKSTILKIIFIIIIIIIVAYGASSGKALEKILPILQFIELNPGYGILIFWGIIVLFNVLCIPLALIFFAGGVVFRPYSMAVLINLFGLIMGFFVCTIITFTFYVDKVEKKIQKSRKLTKFKIAISESGYLMTVMLRYITPFGIGTYIFPGLDVDPYAYGIGTVTAALLRILPDAFFGSLLSNIAQISNSAGQDVRIKYSVGLCIFCIQGSLLTVISCWTNSAMDLVDIKERRMRHKMGIAHLSKRSRIIILVIVSFFAVVMVLGVFLIWTLPRFQPTNA